MLLLNFIEKEKGDNMTNPNKVLRNILGDKVSKNFFMTPTTEKEEPDKCPECGRILPWLSAVGGYSDICPSCER